jgi:hypothetical protein
MGKQSSVHLELLRMLLLIKCRDTHVNVLNLRDSLTRFSTLDFSLNCTPGSPDSWAKTVLHIVSNSRRNLTTKIDSALCRIAGSRNKILSAFTEAVKVTVFQKIGHRGSCLPHGSKIKF